MSITHTHTYTHIHTCSIGMVSVGFIAARSAFKSFNRCVVIPNRSVTVLTVSSHFALYTLPTFTICLLLDPLDMSEKSGWLIPGFAYHSCSQFVWNLGAMVTSESSFCTAHVHRCTCTVKHFGSEQSSPPFCPLPGVEHTDALPAVHARTQT